MLILSCLILLLHHYNIREKSINYILLLSCSSSTLKIDSNKENTLLFNIKKSNERDIPKSMMPFSFTDLVCPKNVQVLLLLQNTFQ